MKGAMNSVRLSQPARIGDRWLSQGAAEVSDDELAALSGAGLLEEGEAASIVADGQAARSFTAEEWEAAVAATARDIAEGLVEAAVTDAVSALEARTSAVESERDQLRNLVVDLEAKLAATNTSEPAAKTAPKMGAAATTKG